MKKFFACFFAVALLLTCCGTAIAADFDSFASSTITGYSAALSPGSSGQIKLTYNVTASSTATSIGVSTIKIYNANGNYAATIKGTTSNGLLTTNAKQKSGTYTYTGGASGVSYYAVVTCTATVGGVTDNKNVTTNTAKAP